jgi:carbamoyl-phosphate synthase small subunit
VLSCDLRVRVSHIGLNDNVVEGLECLDIPAFSVQYHPEAAAGPHDSAHLFDRFIELMSAAAITAAGGSPSDPSATPPTPEGRP